MDHVKIKNRLFEKRKIIAETGCWEWTGLLRDGLLKYGRITVFSKDHKVHRIAAMLWLGLDLDNKEILVLHKCNNPQCFNPEHLYLGNKQDNCNDAIKAGTRTRKLMDDQVLTIRHRFKNGESTWVLAKEYNVASQSLDAVVQRQCYKWL